MLAASQQGLGKEHPDTLQSVHHLADWYQSQALHDKAEPLYRQALASRERVLGETHPDTIETQLHLVVLLVNQERLDPALRLLRTLDQRMRRVVTRGLDSTEQEAVQAALLGRLRDGDDGATGALYAQRFGDIEAELGRFATLFLAADGILDLVAFARLRVPAANAGREAGGDAGLADGGGHAGKDGREDGILYALEVQDLNLEGTELVTLATAVDRSVAATSVCVNGEFVQKASSPTG